LIENKAYRHKIIKKIQKDNAIVIGDGELNS
jgi:hypothetical protein